MSDATKTPTVYTIFMMVRTNPIWLKMKPKDRFAYFESTIVATLKKYPAVKMRFFDVEAFAARVTDMMTWETTDLDGYQSIVEELRETDFWGTYFEIVEILPAVENGFARHYGVNPLSGT